MDCDYNSNEGNQRNLIENTKLKRKRKRKSKFAKVVSQPKPVFDPSDKTFAQYLDEYYKLDCEDIIDNLPCRFKYREVVPNNFGLTVEEILLANDKELNRWCSLKKTVQYRPEHVEKYDKIVYERKAKDENLKRKILPSLYTKNDEKTEDTNETGNLLLRKRKHEEVSNENHTEKKIQKPAPAEKKKRKKKSTSASTKLRENTSLTENNELNDKNLELSSGNSTSTKKKKQKPHLDSMNETEILMKSENIQESYKSNIRQNHHKKTKLSSYNKNKQDYEMQQDGISNARLVAYGINPKKYRKKMKYNNFNKNKQNA
ncbi:protein KRI1 homolog [Agrilus planipennis]|uniref:Protein KRI1 homolog n=1 Tax=Agrilus planipennis TaxID=224129 RepID=A0A7F5R528_AGRPL|nr:protein KRI1 homolog [Agrilus planipennis]